MPIEDFREVLAAMVDPLVACDGDEHILHVNPAAERLLRLDPRRAGGTALLGPAPERLHTYEAQSLLRYLLGRRHTLGGRPVRATLLRQNQVEVDVEMTVGASGEAADQRITLVLRRTPESPDYTDEPVERLAHPTWPAASPSAAERAYQLVFESAPLGLFHFDRGAILQACNDYFARAVGSTKRRLIGLNLLTLRDPAILACVKDALAGRHAYFDGEYQSLTADKRTPMRAHFAPLFNDRGEVEGGMCIVEDVTEQRSAETERVRLLREAQEAIRVRDDFLTIASHELKTPLTPLSLRLASLERRLERQEPVDPALLRHARQHLVRLTALINDLLDASRIEAGRLSLHLEPARLDTLVEHALAHMGPEGPPARVEYSHPFAPVHIRGDAYRLEQVISNLLENALKYSTGDSPVRVTLELRGEFALLSVADEGIGIPVDQQEQLFERYFRARNVSVSSYGGLGLGLYISRDIVERHGGRIWVESEVGRGAIFHVALPLLSADSPPPPEPRSFQQVH